MGVMMGLKMARTCNYGWEKFVEKISGKYGLENNQLGDQDGNARITSMWIIER
jgi:hypothetical protein